LNTIFFTILRSGPILAPEMIPLRCQEGIMWYKRHMVVEAELKALSKPEKFRIMEILWKDLSSDDSLIPSPKWHEDALKEAAERHAKGEAHFSDWNEAKARIRKAVS